MWSKYKILSRVLLVVVCAVIIVYFMPHQHTFTYDYSVGKPWKYSQIIAEYDFPIYKSDAQLEAERDSVLQNLKPFFNFDASVGELQVNNFKRDTGTNITLVLSYRERVELSRLLAEVYARGVISQHDYDLVVDSVKAVSVVSDGVAQVRPVAGLLSPRLAYEFIVKKADSLHLSKEIVGRSSLNNYIAPNLIYDVKRTASVRRDALSNIAPSHGLVLAV